MWSRKRKAGKLNLPKGEKKGKLLAAQWQESCREIFKGNIQNKTNVRSDEKKDPPGTGDCSGQFYCVGVGDTGEEFSEKRRYAKKKKNDLPKKKGKSNRKEWYFLSWKEAAGRSSRKKEGGEALGCLSESTSEGKMGLFESGADKERGERKILRGSSKRKRLWEKNGKK